jgi:D-alanyl-D-alanine carboxypeptidase
LTPDIIAKLKTASDSVFLNSQTPGMIAYIGVGGGKEELYITRGVSNLVTNEPMNINNYFRIGSITKTFVSEAVLILADENKIDVNKPITFYLPDLKIPSGDKITIRMLANMTSGLPEYTSDYNFLSLVYNSLGQTVFTPEELLNIAFMLPMQFEPGTNYSYCNTNYILLGLLIKKVTGKSAADILNEKIFIPLGMKNTFWPNTRYLPYPYTHGYTYDVANSFTDVTNWNPSWAYSAGCLISNFSDLKIWAKEMYDCKLLSDKMKIERFTWRDANAPNIKYSGFGIEKVFDWIGKSGSIPGYNTEVWYNPIKKITIIINTNTWEGDPADVVFESFVNILTPIAAP